MRARLTLWLCLLVSSSLLSAQNLISIEQTGTVPRTVINILLGQLGLNADDGVVYYAVEYTMDNLDGQLDTVSGLFVRPINAGGSGKYPVLVSQHGTTIDKNAVPSNAMVTLTSGVPDLSFLFAAQGYAAIAPDFLNMGKDQEGFHPYVHAETEALAAINMMEALKQTPLYADIVTDELFLSGYSQGGHASMALHEMIVKDYPDLDVTAAGHMSGPYSISDVMLNEVILKDTTFVYVGFLPYTVLSYQAAYPNLEQELDSIFKTPYVPIIQAFRDGYETSQVGLDELTTSILTTYVQEEGDSTFYPFRILNPRFEEELRNDPSSPYRIALRDNDTYDFVNPDPTRLFYCRADDQVSYLNSIVAEDTLKQLGAVDTEAVDVDSDANHTGCIIPATLASLEFFAEVRQSSSTQAIPGSADWRWAVAANELRVFAEAGATYQLSIIDALGRTTASQTYRSGEQVDLSNAAKGWVAVQLIDALGRSEVRKLVLR